MDMTKAQTGSETRAKLLDAARDVIRTKGYAGSTVDDICVAAGVIYWLCSCQAHQVTKDEPGSFGEHIQELAEQSFGTQGSAVYAAGARLCAISRITPSPPQCP
jgi:hypothetical protein